VAASAGIAFIAWELRRAAAWFIFGCWWSPFAGGAASPCLRDRAVRHDFLIPLFVQTVQGLTALDAGLAAHAGALLLGIFMPLGGYLCDRLPAARPPDHGFVVPSRLSTYWMHDVDVNTSFLWMLSASW